MNYKSFNLGDWIGHISGAIEDERELDGNEMRDLVEFLTTLNKEPILDKIKEEVGRTRKMYLDMNDIDWLNGCDYVLSVIDKYKAEMESEE